MSYSNKEDTDSLVGSLNLDSEPNLAGLTTNDLQTLKQLSQDLTLNTEMPADVENQPEIVHEEEVHTEEPPSTSQVETEPEPTPPEEKKVTVPPLRPLTIAPKPSKLPLSLKPVSGQQLLLLQSPGGAGQAIKLVSHQGQELNISNFSISRPITLKPTMKTVTSQGGNISLMQQKPVVMKKIITSGTKTMQIQKPTHQTFTSKTGSHFMVVQKSEPQMKIVQSGGNLSVPANAKTITLQQAQEMGLLAGAKLVPQSPKMITTKPQAKTIKLVPQVTTGTKTISMSQLKSPTKILPATNVGAKMAQRLILKTAGSNQTILPAGQIIQVAGGQTLNTGQVHQINIPGKGMQYIKFVTTSSLADSHASGTTINTIKSTSASTSNLVLSEVKTIPTTSLVTKPMKQTTQMMVLPSNYASSQQQKVAIPMRQAPPPKPAPPPAELPSIEPTAEPNGIRPRKPCNCTKSQCLKLYCECFANGEFCFMCNCMNCFNNLEYEDHRTRAIKACLERNPNAFRPKIGKAKDTSGDLSIRKHTKGCNCKRSGCLKNYCECYEAKIACSNNCKCVGCRNIEESLEKKSMRPSNSGGGDLNNLISSNKSPQKDYSQYRQRRLSNTKQPINFITDDVIEATSQCLLSLCDNAVANMQDDEETIRQIIEEFGRCLTEINSCSTVTTVRGLH